MPSQPSDVSLYELACAATQSDPLQLSPSTFKSLIDSIVDLVIEQSAPVLVWAKLPKGDLWQAALDRLSGTKNPHQQLYLFRSHREEINAMAAGPGTIGPGTMLSDGASEPAALKTLQLGADLLRREYFLIVWSAQMPIAVLAYRPRTSHIAETGTEDSLERKHLLMVCSFTAAIVEQVLSEITRAIVPRSGSLSEPSSLRQTDSPAQIETAGDWQQQLEAILPIASTGLLEQLFIQQLQKQEDLWRRNSSYRKQAELAETLQLQNEELLHTIRTKDEFLNNVGQELRTPLTTIKTALSLLNSPNIKPFQRQRYMELITRECDRQSSLITSLLDLVQLDQMAEQTVIQAVNLAEVVPGVVSTYQPLAQEKGVRLAYTIPDDLPPIACVAAWLKQIVINLLHNGIKFTPRDGQVWVRAKLQGDSVQLEFRDTGIGIPANEIPKIFDRFFRARHSSEATSGAGLGLTIVQQLLIYCGGTISVQSKLGEGSTFTVLLPIYRSLRNEG